jgi:uncharacterized protein YciI
MATKQTYVVWAPADHTNLEVLDHRAKSRPDHLKNIERLAKEGTLSVSFLSFCGTTTYSIPTTELGGPMFDTESGNPGGSLIVVEAESLEAVHEIIHNDPYWTGNYVRVISPSLTAVIDECAAYGVFLLALQWNKEKVEIKTVQLTIVGAEKAKP